MSVVLAFLELSYLKDAVVRKRPLKCMIKKHTGASPKAGSPTSTEFNSCRGCLLSRRTAQLTGHKPHSSRMPLLFPFFLFHSLPCGFLHLETSGYY